MGTFKINTVKPTRGRIIVQLLGKKELQSEMVVDGIILPDTTIRQSKEALVVAVPDDINYNDKNLDDEPIRRLLIRPGNIVLLNYLQVYAEFEAVDPDGEAHVYLSITPDSVMAIYKDGAYTKLNTENNARK